MNLIKAGYSTVTTTENSCERLMNQPLGMILLNSNASYEAFDAIRDGASCLYKPAELVDMRIGGLK